MARAANRTLEAIAQPKPSQVKESSVAEQIITPAMMGSRDRYTGREYTCPLTKYVPMEEKTGSRAARAEGREHTEQGRSDKEARRRRMGNEGRETRAGGRRRERAFLRNESEWLGRVWMEEGKSLMLDSLGA
eukprot:478774-Prorocentrum_minimum.AAC.1